MAIVDFLQAVEIEEQQAERLAVALRSPGLGVQPGREPPRIEQICQRVGFGQLTELVGVAPKNVTEKGENNGRRAPTYI